MTLSEYKQERDLTLDAIGKELNCTRQMAGRLVRGDIKPSLDMAFRIERMTRGKVKASSFIEQP